nr:hypothetical protein [uncultured Holophaga sp.]
MSDLTPMLKRDLGRAVAHVLARQGAVYDPSVVEAAVEHLFSGLVQGPDRSSPDWSMTWGHLIQYFWDQGASFVEASEMAVSHFTAVLHQVCDEVCSGQLEAEAESVPALEQWVRHAVEQVVVMEMVGEEG